MINRNKFEQSMEYYISKIYDDDIVCSIEDNGDIFVNCHYSFRDMVMVILKVRYKYILFEHYSDKKYYFKIDDNTIEELKKIVIYKYLDFIGFISYECMDMEEDFMNDIMSYIIENQKQFHKKYGLR